MATEIDVAVETFDLAASPRRELNGRLHALAGAADPQPAHWRVVNPSGAHALAVGTADGFAVLRDPIACKPAVMAETDDWVAMASEYRAIAVLPGAEGARTWEPEPGRVYSWERQAV